MYLKTREEIFDLLQQAVEALVPLRDFEARLAYLFVDREGWPILYHGEKALGDQEFVRREKVEIYRVDEGGLTGFPDAQR